MLKAQLLPDVNSSYQNPSGLATADTATTPSVYASAVEALRWCVAALGPGLLDKEVLADVSMEDLKQYLGVHDGVLLCCLLHTKSLGTLLIGKLCG